MRKTTFCSLAGHSLLPARLRRLIIVTGALCVLAFTASAHEAIWKSDLEFGFNKLTDCAPLKIAKEPGFFEEEGPRVTFEAFTPGLTGAAASREQPAGCASSIQDELVASGLPIRSALITSVSH